MNLGSRGGPSIILNSPLTDSQTELTAGSTEFRGSTSFYTEVTNGGIKINGSGLDIQNGSITLPSDGLKLEQGMNSTTLSVGLDGLKESRF
jgi:hypothetical protein